MKTTRKLKPDFVRTAFVLLLMATSVMTMANNNDTKGENPDGDQKIMLALLLDTSNSMDGLIEQAKSQLWRIVNELSSAKCGNGSKPSIKIALYEYGNDRLSANSGYIRMVSGLTSDLDLISEKLFSLTTNGGSEYCGQVIKTSLSQLNWSESRADLKLIFIAGNEPFTQGEVSYRVACEMANERNVIVNTIFCGDHEEGIQTSWKRGADITGGSYMSIEQDRRTVYVASPYDDRIEVLNESLNDTYIYYGSSGKSKKDNQATQDKNAEGYSKSNKVERAISKSTHAYDNKSWDLVDASRENDEAVETAKEEYLPEEMKRMDVKERKQYVEMKAQERARIQKEIKELSQQREKYIAAHQAPGQTGTLDAAMIKAVREQAKGKNLKWD